MIMTHVLHKARSYKDRMGRWPKYLILDHTTKGEFLATTMNTEGGTYFDINGAYIFRGMKILGVECPGEDFIFEVVG